MPARIELQDSGRIVYCALSDPITATNIDDMVTADFGYLETAELPVYHLVDVSKLFTLPVGMIRYSEAPTFNHPRMGGIVIVGANTFVRMIAQMIFKMAGLQKICFAASTEEGLAFIRRLMSEEQAA